MSAMALMIMKMPPEVSNHTTHLPQLPLLPLLPLLPDCDIFCFVFSHMMIFMRITSYLNFAKMLVRMGLDIEEHKRNSSTKE